MYNGQLGVVVSLLMLISFQISNITNPSSFYEVGIKIMTAIIALELIAVVVQHFKKK